MPGRRPADGPPADQPAAKKPALDMASIRAQIAAKKAEVEARLKGAGVGSGSASPATPGSRGQSSSAAPAAAGPAAMPPKPTVDPNIAAKIAAAKARIDALQNKRANPYLSGSGSASPAAGSSTPRATAGGSGGGVSSVALHPLLMGGSSTDNTGSGSKNEKQAMRDRYRTMAPKFSTVRANQLAVEEAQKAADKLAPNAVTPVVTNPYMSASASGSGTPATGANGAAPGAADDGPAPRERRARKLQFAAPGKYVRKGNQLRNEAKLEALKQRIAAQSVKAGLDSEFDVVSRSLKRQAPPEMEWWDAAIFPPGVGYDDLDAAEAHFKNDEDSLITHLILHPIPIAAPQDRVQSERGLMLTKKEAKKMRRQRRLAELEDKRDRQKMGLLPPDPPKVRLANLMKVLTSDAVQDPTKVEAKVRREVAMRQLRHEKDNDSRKLSKTERHEKETAKLAEKERTQGLIASVYIIKYLTNGRHRFKVRETARHDALSGMCLYANGFALVLVEGVAKKSKHFRQLMLHRIDWTEEPRPIGAPESGSDGEGDGEGEGEGEGNGNGEKADKAGNGTAGPGSRDEEEDSPDMSQNKCDLIWEGEIPERSFQIFRARHAETDAEGKDWLGGRYEGLWDLAKRWTWGEDL